MIKFTTSTKKDYWLTVSQIENMASPSTIILDGTEMGIIINDNVTIWIDPTAQKVYVEELYINEEQEQAIYYPDIEYMTQDEVEHLLDFEEVCYQYRKKLLA